MPIEPAYGLRLSPRRRPRPKKLPYRAQKRLHEYEDSILLSVLFGLTGQTRELRPHEELGPMFSALRPESRVRWTYFTAKDLVRSYPDRFRLPQLSWALNRMARQGKIVPSPKWHRTKGYRAHVPEQDPRRLRRVA